MFIAFFMYLRLMQVGAATAQDEKPLPDLDMFLQSIRNHLRSNQTLLNQYTYTEKTTLRQLDKNGKTKNSETREYEIYPSLEPDAAYRKLISKNGKPLSAEENAKQDREFEKKWAQMGRKLQKESAADKREREAKEEKEKQKERMAVDEAFRLYNITMVARDIIDGQSTIALDFHPRPGFKVKTDEGKILSKVRGKAWFSERDHELIRLDIELIDSINLALGLLAKVKAGTRMQFERCRLNNEIYLPARSLVILSGKLFMFKGLNMEVETVYSDYKKFSVDTSVQYESAKKP
jgi:hypothetical protein